LSRKPLTKRGFFAQYSRTNVVGVIGERSDASSDPGHSSIGALDAMGTTGAPVFRRERVCI